MVGTILKLCLTILEIRSRVQTDVQIVFAYVPQSNVPPPCITTHQIHAWQNRDCGARKVLCFWSPLDSREKFRKCFGQVGQPSNLATKMGGGVTQEANADQSLQDGVEPLELFDSNNWCRSRIILSLFGYREDVLSNSHVRHVPDHMKG